MRRTVAVALVLASACTARTPVAEPTPPPSSSRAPAPTPSPSASATPAPRLSSDRIMATIRALVALGPREATSPAYRASARLVRERLAASGYRTRLQSFSVPAGTVDGTPVRAGRSLNVIAEPLAFDPSEPHLLVGAHLDTVPDSRGANDNASGVAALVEIARLVALRPPPVPVAFVALGAEERRRQSRTRSVLSVGARVYIQQMSAARADALQAFVNLDMVGRGEPVLVLGTRALVRATVRRARAAGIPARARDDAGRLYSDHSTFREHGYPVVWLWTGDHPSLHQPSDTVSVVRERHVERVARLAWLIVTRPPLNR